MPFSPEFLAKWQHIVDSVDTSDPPPLECVSRVIIRLYGNRRKNINLRQLRQAGMDMPAIEALLDRHFEELGDTVKELELVVDLAAVAEIVQPKTDRLLKGIK
mgnify:FL=1|jgi:hypothetical protein